MDFVAGGQELDGLPWSALKGGEGCIWPFRKELDIVQISGIFITYGW